MPKTAKRLFALLAAVILSGSMCVCAADCETYNYSYSGKKQTSPPAYESEYDVSVFGEAGTLKTPEDLVYDEKTDRIIIADSGNDRIVITDTEFKSIKIIGDFVSKKGNDSLKKPMGVYVAPDGNLYVADTGNKRILVFDSDYSFLREVPSLSTDILPEGFTYSPKSIGVDSAGNIYVISQNTNMGVISLKANGDFVGFIGAQRVSANPLELLWRSFMSEEQKNRSESFVPVEYSNITVDSKGFIYVTAANIDRYNLHTAIWSRDKSSTYAPIKKINPRGTDVLKRNGFFPPAGDIGFDAYEGDDGIEPSQITEVTVMQYGMYSLVDSSQNKIFTYDSNGNLLYAFGGIGEALGLYSTLCAIDYNGDYLYALDSFDATVTVSRKTDYVKQIENVINLQENREYEKAKTSWTEIAKLNNNFDLAYYGMGTIAVEDGRYKDAMEYFKLIDDKSNYSRAYKLERKKFLDKWGIAVFAVAIVLVVVILKIFSAINKYNKKVSFFKASGKLKDELLYGFYAMKHPFAGFWGIKMEKRGSLRASLIIWAWTALSSVFAALGTGYLQKDSTATVLSALSSIIIPLILWCVSNMCFTSLMDGKGTFKDVITAAGYSMLPYNIVAIPCTLIGYVLIDDEISIVSFIVSVALFWSVGLVFLSMMTVHEYSLGKNVVVSLLTILGIAIILFVLLIFFNLIGKVESLIVNMVNEIVFRS